MINSKMAVFWPRLEAFFSVQPLRREVALHVTLNAALLLVGGNDALFFFSVASDPRAGLPICSFDPTMLPLFLSKNEGKRDNFHEISYLKYFGSDINEI